MAELPEGANGSGVFEAPDQACPTKAPSAAVDLVAARVCEAERVPLGGPSGHDARVRTPSPQETAERVRAGMFANDRASKALGMRIVEVGPGTATLAMAVRDDMLNGHDICHGGLIATLADSAFAFACNSYDELTVASGFGIDFIASGRLGDELTARCREVTKAGRTGVYDTEVSNQRGERVAVFRGRSYSIKGKPAVAG